MDDLDPSKLTDRELMIQTYTNVKNISDTLDKHVKNDDEVIRTRIIPLWEAHQQRIGAEKVEKKDENIQDNRRNYRSVLINTVISAVTAIATIKMIK